MVSARVLECLQWVRGRLPDYHPSRGALEVADFCDAMDTDQPIAVPIVIRS